MRSLIVISILSIFCLAAFGQWERKAASSSSSSSSGSVTNAAGSSGAVQFNQGGVFNGTNRLVWDRTNETLRIAGTGNGNFYSVEAIGVGSPSGSQFSIGANGAIHWSVSTTGTLFCNDGVESVGQIGYEPKQLWGKTVFAGNINVRTNVYATNNIGYRVTSLPGVGGANTNFTLRASGHQKVIYIDAGTTNVNIVAIMAYDSEFEWCGTVILTNRTATSRQFSLGATTNNWISLQHYDGIVAPFTVTNSQAARFEWAILGTNVQYSYKPMPLPSN